MPSETSAIRLSQPHAFGRMNRADHTGRTRLSESPVLPRSDPFAIPAPSLQDSLTPLVRFLMLVTLFTIAGTIILISRRENPPAKAAVQPGSTAVQQSLEPATVTAVEQPDVVLTAQGPPPSIASPPGEPTASNSGLPDSESVDGREPTGDSRVSGDSGAASSDSPYPTTEFPAIPFTSASSHDLPQVQTSDPPPAVAQFSGHILEVPARHASHDNDESSVY